jgi:hypothetical protein
LLGRSSMGAYVRHDCSVPSAPPGRAADASTACG